MIAVISDSYGHIMENKERYALIERVSLYADFINIIYTTSSLKTVRYLFIALPTEVDETEQQDWDGSLNLLKR